MVDISFFIVILFVICTFCQVECTFSGVYRPSLKFQPDDSAGAFLMKKPRFTSTMMFVKNATSFQQRNHVDESAMTVVLRAVCSTCLNFQTRDFMDYFLENLSTTVEQLGIDQREVVNYLSKSLKRTIDALIAVAKEGSSLDRRQEETMAVLVFNGDMTRRISPRMKVLFFQATFWSVYRYHKHIRVMVKSSADFETVRDLQLPIEEVVNLDLDLATRVKDMKYSDAVSLVQGALIKESMERVAETWHEDKKWSPFKYLYFSVGDQLLHARRFTDLYNALDVGIEGNFLIAPHRMQTLPVAQSFPPAVQDALWPTEEAVAKKLAPFETALFHDRRAKGTSRRDAKVLSPQWLPGISIHSEALLGVKGSCCDNGRVLFPDCQSFEAQQQSKMKVLRGLVTAAPPPDPVQNVAHVMHVPEDFRRLTQVRYKLKQSRPQWASCTEWGARNFSSWLRVGPEGFTMPPVTVHLAQCSYSRQRELCPLPPTSAATSFGQGSCGRMPVPLHLQQQSDRQGEGGKTYLHCSEVGAVRRDPGTQHLLSRAVRQTLREQQQQH